MSNYIHVPPGSPEVPKLDITVSEREGPGYCQGTLQLLRRLRPHWRPEEVTLQLFTDGVTNKLMDCYVGDITDDVVLVKMYGNKTELLVDRDEEVKSFHVLQAHGCAPQLYCMFSNGLCYEFMRGVERVTQTALLVQKEKGGIVGEWLREQGGHDEVY